KNNRNIVLIERESIERYQKMKEDSYSLMQVCGIIGLDFRKTLDLVNQGFIKAIHGPSIDGYPNWYIKKEHLNDFIDSIFKRVRFEKNINEKWRPFHRVNMDLRHVNIDTTKLIQLITNGKFKTV